jgi:perosamine synthetase
MTHSFIPVAAPVFIGNERKYVDDCIDSTWVSSAGKYIKQFEDAFADFCQVKHALSCSNGTVALHLPLMAFGVGPGDEVIVPTFTYVATANCVAYCGAKPVFVDSEPETWNINPARIEEAITPRTKGIIVVHVYGHPVDMDPVMEIATMHNLFVIEDAAEAHGAEYRGRRVGSIAHVSTFSFFGNKVINTGEGGMVVTNDDALAARMRQLKGQGMDPNRRYWFTMIGYNYRMTNIEAAIGLAQLEKFDWHFAQRRRVADHYKSKFSGNTGVIVQKEQSWAKSSYWMTSVLLGDNFPERDEVIKKMSEANIETRPFFYPMHILPMYCEGVDVRSFPVANWISARGINLPSSGNLTAEDLDYVCNTLIRVGIS